MLLVTSPPLRWNTLATATSSSAPAPAATPTTTSTSITFARLRGRPRNGATKRFDSFLIIVVIILLLLYQNYYLRDLSLGMAPMISTSSELRDAIRDLWAVVTVPLSADVSSDFLSSTVTPLPDIKVLFLCAIVSGILGRV